MQRLGVQQFWVGVHVCSCCNTRCLLGYVVGVFVIVASFVACVAVESTCLYFLQHSELILVHQLCIEFASK